MKHALGRPFAQNGHTCGDCVWSAIVPDSDSLACCAAPNLTLVRSVTPEEDSSNHPEVMANWPACDRWEGALDCLACAACCGPAFDAVEIGDDDAVLTTHPDRVIVIDHRPQLRRTSSNHCCALGGDLRCAIYSDRPQCCRDFEQASANCVFARRRAQLSLPWPYSP